MNRPLEWCKAAWCGGGKEELLSHRKRSPLPHKGGLKNMRAWCKAVRQETIPHRCAEPPLHKGALQKNSRSVDCGGGRGNQPLRVCASMVKNRVVRCVGRRYGHCPTTTTTKSWLRKELRAILSRLSLRGLREHGAKPRGVAIVSS